jgi:hypothetical protein
MTDTLEFNKALVRRLYEEGFNQGNVDVLDKIVAPDVVTHDPIILDAPTGPDAIRGGIEMIRKAFHDFHVEVIDLLAAAGRRTRGERCARSSSGASPTDASLRAGAWRTASSSSNSSAWSRPTTSSRRGPPRRIDPPLPRLPRRDVLRALEKRRDVTRDRRGMVAVPEWVLHDRFAVRPFDDRAAITKHVGAHHLRLREDG